jgi:tetratricopeptide (TPR) repeat protein
LGGFLHSLGFGGKYARGTGRSRSGPVPPPDSKENARYFQPLAIEQEDWEISPSEVRIKRQNRLLRPRSVRRVSAFIWVAGRKIARLHRALPLWIVALFYLAVAGVLCFYLTRPLMRPPEVAVTPLPERPVVKPSLPEAIADVSRMITEKNFVQATAELQKLESDYPDDPRVLMVKGAVLAGERAYPEAREAFQKALDLSPTSTAALMNLAEIEFVMGSYADAEAHYRKLLPSQPKNPLLLLRLYLCAKLRKDPEAASQFLQSPAIGPQSLEWYYMNAAENLFDGNKTEGTKPIDKARLLFGEKTRPYDRTLFRLGLIPDNPGN